ncbi:hypothetical protein ACIRPK_33055 [Kitasatospora sp. NPDC101801]|uniref:hypothetical protein n=1 Tax=Kitasatospora sp. NPDC101801 TaxID=3364103 RepID=UPI0038019FCB
MMRVGLGGEQHDAWSTDGGASWKLFANAPANGAGAGTAAVSADGSTLVRTSDGRTPSYSADRGTTWAAVSDLPKDTVVVTDRSAANTFDALSGGTLYAGTNGARSFAERVTTSGTASSKPLRAAQVTCGSPAGTGVSRTPPTAGPPSTRSRLRAPRTSPSSSAGR